VLPLANTNVDPATEYLSDGITESLIGLLAQLPGLRVMARSTVFRYKGRDVDAQEAGRALKVRAVLTGQVVQRDNRLVIKIELVDVKDGSQLWGEHYDRDLSDILTIEKAIAGEIAGTLRPRLTREHKRRLDRPRTENADAYRLYLQGRHHWNKRTAEGLKKSIKLFEQAIDIDPTYALAYAGIADASINLGGWGHLPFRETYPRAKAAALRALAIDEDLAEAHVSLAMVLKEYDWDWPAAEREYRRALSLNPNYATAWQWCAEFLACVGRHEEAAAMFQRAIDLDPLSLIIHATMGRHGYFFARRYDDAVAHLKKTLDMDDQFWVPHLWLGWTYANIGRLEEAEQQLLAARSLDDNLEIMATLGYTHGRAGRRREAQQTLDELRQLSRTRYVSPMLPALVAIGMGEHGQALDWLEQGCTDRAQMMSELKSEPVFDPLRSDPRFADLMRRVGLDDVSLQANGTGEGVRA
jgi:TolB-like protein/Tfp pilus assembly protein PilF